LEGCGGKMTATENEASAVDARPNDQTEVARFSLNFRVQHIILFTSLIVLGITGLSLMFHDNWFAALIIRLEGGVETRGTIHRLAATVLICVSIYHVFYVLLTESAHKEFMKLKPKGKDFRDFYQMIKFDLGKSDEAPEFEKFDYKQKFQYGGVVVGLAIMIFTGFILWFETLSMAIMPKWVIDVTFVVHGYEGLWAFMVLFVWHMYNVHFNPTVFPMDKSWITGKISMTDLKEKHPLEYQEIVEKRQRDNE
jgi:cytochrome b subunit of formate dehydrogenase